MQEIFKCLCDEKIVLVKIGCLVYNVWRQEVFIFSVFVGGNMKNTLFFALFVCSFSPAVLADLVDVQYVDEAVANRVDTSASANQTMAGTYTVTGSFDVPTQPLPTSVAASAE